MLDIALSTREPASREKFAEILAKRHFSIDHSIKKIRRLTAPTTEIEDHEPVKLLEATRNTVAVGIRPVYFGADPEHGFDYPTIIVQVTPGEYDQIARQQSSLPENWRLGEEFARRRRRIGRR